MYAMPKGVKSKNQHVRVSAHRLIWKTVGFCRRIFRKMTSP